MLNLVLPSFPVTSWIVYTVWLYLSQCFVLYPFTTFWLKKYLVMHFGTFLRSILFMLDYYQFSSLDSSLLLSCLHFLSLFKFQFVSCSFLKAEKLFSFRVFIGFIWDSSIQSWRYFILIILLYVTICMSLWAFDFIGNFSC